MIAWIKSKLGIETAEEKTARWEKRGYDAAMHDLKNGKHTVQTVIMLARGGIGDMERGMMKAVQDYETAIKPS